MDGRQLAAATARQGLRTAASAATGGATLWLRLAVPIAVVVAALAGLLLLVVLLAAAGGPAPAAASGGMLGINPTILSAYLQAAQLSPGIDRGCEVRWQVLAGIGRVESNHGQHWGPRTEIRGNGDVAPPIIGPRLDGTQGTARITDTDQGRWDRDTVYDRAVGPMQFIPSSWEVFGQDGNGDGRADPHNVFDATLAAAAHLCWAPAPPSSGVKDLSDAGELAAALFSYNRSQAYVSTVLGWIDCPAAAGVSDPWRTSSARVGRDSTGLRMHTVRRSATGGILTDRRAAPSSPTVTLGPDASSWRLPAAACSRRSMYWRYSSSEAAAAGKCVRPSLVT
ncbi:MAG: lytic transglycosylase domain-containing protein [Egibacteraceae bacterium]